MKRNSLFMWAYISFIYISIIVRIFLDFPLWTPLVLAITLSSILFSLEDLFATLEKAIHDSCDIADQFVSYAHRRFDDESKFFKKLDTATELYKDTEHDISDLQSSFESIRSYTEKAQELVMDLETQVRSKRKIQKRNQRIGDMLSYLGFLVLFCTLIFASIASVSGVIQDIFTVLSFSIVLVTRQIGISTSKKIRREMIQSQNAIQAQAEVRDCVLESDEKLDYMIELIETIMKDSEELSNAD